jgi:transposase
VDEAEFHLNPELAYCWSPRGSQVLVPSAGLNRRVPVFGALDAMTGEVTALLTERKRSDDMLDFLEHLFGHYAAFERVTLFMDNCSIHHAQKVRDYLHACRDNVRVIWNAAYAPNLNLIERFWGHLKRSAFSNHFFETVDNLERAIMNQINTLNDSPTNPFRLQLSTVQHLLRTT